MIFSSRIAPGSNYTRNSNTNATRAAQLPQQQQASPPSPAASAQQNAETIGDLQQRVADLEARLLELQTAIQVDAAGGVMIHTDGELTLSGRTIRADAQDRVDLLSGLGGSVELTASGVNIIGTGNVNLTATTFEISASMIKGNSGMSQFSGVVQCDTIIATSVVGSSYTPGAGNIW